MHLVCVVVVCGGGVCVCVHGACMMHAWCVHGTRVERTGSCGMMASRERNSLRPSVLISTPST
eukprot:scaffold5289_cov60-Phaeocystis_antarctica.AAC.6